jgi:hypothetical protein
MSSVTSFSAGMNLMMGNALGRDAAEATPMFTSVTPNAIDTAAATARRRLVLRPRFRIHFPH